MRRFPLVLLTLSFALLSFSLTADEGMYPLSMIHKLDLKDKGLKIDIADIYNPDGVSLVDAICEVGGGTGEFVSEDGLILTNHHIAFSAVAAASTSEADYLKDGFTAFKRSDEIPAKGYTCSITEQYEDVTEKIMEGISPETPPVERNRRIAERMRTLAEECEAGRNNIRCEVSEMYPGKSYVLFTYRIIRDVRLVYVPPVAIGEFGGEFDNWIWPRHTGDFSFMRAYVAPDGSTADFSENNVPFKPKKHLEINPNGVNDGDFVMILGYPGRTYRHKTSHYIRMHEEFYLPFIAEHFDWLINRLKAAGEHDRDIELALADHIKSYANTTKNFKGKLQGLRRLDLTAKKAAEERELQKYINASPEHSAAYGNVLEGLEGIYKTLSSSIRQELASRLFVRSSNVMQLAMTVNGYATMEKSETERRNAAWSSITALKEELLLPVEKDIMKHWLAVAAELPDDASTVAMRSTVDANGGGEKGAEAFVEKAFANSVLLKEGALDKLQNMSGEEIAALNDPLLQLAAAMQIDFASSGMRSQERNGTLNRLEAELLDVKMAWKETDFIPDANSTLRLTHGYIRGYAPADATYYSPITTLRGVIEKHTGKSPYNVPQKLIDLYQTKNYDKQFESEELEDVPVAILYNMDTTGGNSGSPILDAYGRLIGVNFDRAYEATINDYQWSEDYSRSIGVDIRYVLFIAKYLGGADFLLDELGVDV